MFEQPGPGKRARKKLGTLRIQRRGRQRERQKNNGLISKTTTLHVRHPLFVHFFPAYARLRREILFLFMRLDMVA